MDYSVYIVRDTKFIALIWNLDEEFLVPEIWNSEEWVILEPGSVDDGLNQWNKESSRLCYVHADQKESGRHLVGICCSINHNTITKTLWIK